jgi:hypothetical protein
MNETLSPRRGRPPLAEKSAIEAQALDRPLVGKRRRASVGGHSLKLTAPVREGFVRRWVNDDGNRIADAEELAYEFVSDPAIKSSGEGSRVSRLVGTKANGEPLRAYLMETPVEEYQAGLREKAEHNAKIDEAIRRGVDPTGQIGPESETYGQGSIQQDR